MKRLSFKLILIGFFVMILTSAIPNILWAIFGEGERPTTIEPQHLLIGGFITVTISITIYSVILERFVIKRVKDINRATQKVASGDFDISIKDPFRDEVSQLAKNFNLMTNELKQNEYLNKNFIRNFSHEIKTPLATIKGYTELLQNSELSELETQEYTSIIISESKRLSDLSKNMLLISQLDHTNIVGDMKPFNITEEIRSILLAMQLEWEAKNLTIEMDVTDITIESNQELMYHVFRNLIANAIAFTEEQNSIQITIKEQEKVVQVQISNPGILAKEERERLFDLFYIKDKSRFEKSNGIGLTLTKKIVEKLKGTITVSSENNRITFVVAIPKNDSTYTKEG